MDNVHLQPKVARKNQSLVNMRQQRKSKPPVKRLLLPSIIFVAVLTQIPFLITIFYSFTRWDIMRPDLGVIFSGIQQFQDFFTNPSMLEVLWNTILLSFGSLIFCLVLGLLFALLMNREFFGRNFVRTLIVSPFFVMPAVSGIVWKTLITNPNSGYAAYFADLFHATPVDWLAKYPLAVIILIVVWQWTPFFMLVLLAGLQSLPDEQLEAAQIDGANHFQRLIYVILPHLMKFIEIVSMIGLIFILQVFAEIYVTTAGGPGYSSTNLSFQTFREGFMNWQVGSASAVGVIAVIFTIVIMMILFKFMKRFFKEEIS